MTGGRHEPSPDLDVVPAGVLTVDASGTIRYANATMGSMIGRSRDEVIGRHIDRLLPAPSRIFFSTHLFPLLRVQRVAEEVYVPMTHGDGTELPMLINGRARQAEGGDLFDLVAVPMRVRNKLESELIAARRLAEEGGAAKDRFLSVISHELRSPLTGIRGYAELLLRGSRGALTDGQRTYVERIRDAGLYQEQLIEDILDFAAIRGDRQLSVMATSVESLLARAEALLAVRAEQEARALERTPRPASGKAIADARAVQQILLNLGTNALKYGSSGTPVRITATHADGRVRIAVADSGPGIAPEQLERIFEPFVRMPGADEGSSKQGIGLGLAISRDLARAMGGDITVESIVGEGSTFTLELPGRADAS